MKMLSEWWSEKKNPSGNSQCPSQALVWTVHLRLSFWGHRWSLSLRPMIEVWPSFSLSLQHPSPSYQWFFGVSLQRWTAAPHPWARSDIPQWAITLGSPWTNSCREETCVNTWWQSFGGPFQPHGPWLCQASPCTSSPTTSFYQTVGQTYRHNQPYLWSSTVTIKKWCYGAGDHLDKSSKCGFKATVRRFNINGVLLISVSFIL